MMKIRNTQDVIRELTNSQNNNLSFLEDLDFNDSTTVQITIDAILELITKYIYPAKAFLISSNEDKLYYDISDSSDIEIHGLQLGLLLEKGISLEYHNEFWKEILENAGIEIDEPLKQERIYVIWRAMQMSKIVYEILNYTRQLERKKLNITIADKVDRLFVPSWLYNEIIYWEI